MCHKQVSVPVLSHYRWTLTIMIHPCPLEAEGSITLVYQHRLYLNLACVGAPLHQFGRRHPVWLRREKPLCYHTITLCSNAVCYQRKTITTSAAGLSRICWGNLSNVFSHVTLRAYNHSGPKTKLFFILQSVHWHLYQFLPSTPTATLFASKIL